MTSSWSSAGCGPPSAPVEVVGHDQVVRDDPEDDRLGGTRQLGEGGEDGGPAADDP
jgi:hypothetical protein